MKADAIVSSICRGSRYKVTNHISKQLWYLFCVPIVALITRNDGALSLLQEIFLDSSSHVCVSLLHQCCRLTRCLKVSGRRQSKGQVSRWEHCHRNTTPQLRTVAMRRIRIYHQAKFSKHVQTQQNGSDFTGIDVYCKTLIPRTLKRQARFGSLNEPLLLQRK